ncbi:unnamed protein product [Oikopleura dioica]|uniref:Peptidase M12A domain-containing protein n=1 Tax=Oikopleura dioica TaxID=34765 RepID=E4Y420_OIKDI|nr:unnamed protein product [Oikopleura dioica]
MQMLQFVLLFQSCLAFDWQFSCGDCNRHNIFGRDCNRGPKFCTDCLEVYVDNFDASKSDFTTRSFPCTEENEDLCKFTCLSECNKASNCWTGYGYREEDNTWTCKWISSKSWTFNSGPTRESSGAVRNLAMFRKMRIGKNFAGTIEKRMRDMSYSQMCHAKKNSKSLSTHSYFIPIPCRDYESSCIFGFVVDSRTDRIQQDGADRCYCADPFKVVDNFEKSTKKIDENFHFGDIRIFDDDGELENQFVCTIWQKSLEYDEQIRNFASKIVKPKTIGGYQCNLRANERPKIAELWTDYYCDGYLVPYEFSQDRQEKLRGEDKPRVKKALENAILHLEQTTQIKLIPVEEFLQKTQLEDAFSNNLINFKNCDREKHMCHKISFANTGGHSCSSLVGKNGKMMVHTINLGPMYCHSVVNILHELLHAFSFMHEHSRPDRDEYIQMFPENYSYGQEHNFAILPKEKFNTRAESSFDFASIMLYSPAAGNRGDPTWKRRDGKPFMHWFF